MHTNCSLEKDGVNAFYDPDAPRQLSETCMHFIGGLLKHAKAITRVANPTINSYKRLVPGYEAPCYISWSAGNRSALVRVPTPRGNSTRVEFRSPDPTCNPTSPSLRCSPPGWRASGRRSNPRRASIRTSTI